MTTIDHSQAHLNKSNPSTCVPQFCQIALSGADGDKFLQAQLTINVQKIGADYLPCAICNLKGRAQFGLWIKKIDGIFYLAASQDLEDELRAHIKKYGAFSKITLSDSTPIYPTVAHGAPTFSENRGDAQQDEWAKISLSTGNYWLTRATCAKFAPQELRLHQRGGVDYNKGCYLGQEIVARLYFKSAPKAFLHLLTTKDIANLTNLDVVNACWFDDKWLALAVARPETLAKLAHVSVLPLPPPLDGSVARVV